MFVPIRNFGKFGVIHDTVGETLPIGAWSDALNVRFTGREFEKMLEPALDSTFTPGGGLVKQGWSDSISTYMAVATQTEIYFLLSDGPGGDDEWVLAGSGYSDEGQWQAFSWGDTCIFNNGIDPPQIFNNGTLQFEDLPKWGLISTATDIANGSDPSKDTKASCKVILPYKNFLVALGVSENGLYQPNTVWWSDSTALAGLATSISGGGPPDWDYESPASLSGKTEMGTGDGPIRWGAQLNENLIVYTDSSASALTFVGGTFVMSTRRLFNKGCAGLHLAVEFNNRHFVVARDQLYVHDGSTVSLIAKDRVEEEFFRRAGKGGRFGGSGADFTSMQVVKDPDRKEILVLFDGSIEIEVTGEVTPTDTEWETVYTATRAHNGTANDPHRDTYNNGSIIESDGAGRVLFAGEGVWDVTPGDDEDYSLLAISTDFGANWDTTIDCGEALGSPSTGNDGGCVYSMAYAADVDRWFVMNNGAAINYSDDGGLTWYFIRRLTGGDPNYFTHQDCDGIATTPEGIVFGGGKALDGAFNDYHTAYYWGYEEAGYAYGFDEQQVCFAGAGGGSSRQAVYYNGRMLVGKNSKILEPEEFNESVGSDHTYHGTSFPQTYHWATLGDGRILAAKAGGADRTQLHYDMADMTDAENSVFTSHAIQTSFADTCQRSANIFNGGGYFLAFIVERDGQADPTNRVAMFLSTDGVTWGDEIIITLPDDPVNNYSFEGTPFHATYAGAGYWLLSFHQSSNGRYVVGRIRIATPGTYTRQGRFALVYNFEDDNYTWMDAGKVSGSSIIPASWVHYTFDAGWLTRWDSDNLDGVTWADLVDGYAPWGDANWNDFASSGTEKNMYWLTSGAIYKADQAVETSGVKEYFVKRVQIDLDDLNAKWTTNLVKHLKQFVFHLQTPSEVESPNTFDITAGWAQNLMDNPEWVSTGTVELNTTANNGAYKWDVRTSGRYLSLMLSFNSTDEIRMTGADIDVEPHYGR